MKINFIKPVKGSGKSNRVSLQKRGKLTFPVQVREELGLTYNYYYKIGSDADDRNKKTLYLLKTKEKESDSIKVNKSGEVQFLQVAFALPSINVDSENKKYSVNHSVVVIDKMTFIKLDFEEK